MKKVEVMDVLDLVEEEASLCAMARYGVFTLKDVPRFGHVRLELIRRGIIDSEEFNYGGGNRNRILLETI